MALSDKDIKEVREAFDKIMKRYMALDAEGLTERCTDDFIMVLPDAKIEQARGKASLNDLFAKGMSEFESLDIEYDIYEINGDGDLAYVLSPNKDKFRPSGSNETIVSDNCQTLMAFERQSDGAWKMKLQMCVVADNEQQA